MLPLVDLTAEEIGRIVEAVPGGASNVQDIYPLAPLQEGILFHHLSAVEGDPYLLHTVLGIESRAGVEELLAALQAVIERHDILRTAVVWEGLSQPVQVVWRQAPLAVEEVRLDAAGGDVAEQLRARADARRYRLDVRTAPLLRVLVAQDEAKGRWVVLVLHHHLALDHVGLEIVQAEMQAHALGRFAELPAPVAFRNFVGQARLGVSREQHEAYFRAELGEVDEATLPFGLAQVQGDGSGIAEARQLVEGSLSARVRTRARALGVSAASLLHLAWAQVVGRTSGREDVVFGTVLLGRLQGMAGSDRALGMFINTLPVRVRLGDGGVEAVARRTHASLSGLVAHEHAPLALAQRCSGVPAPLPLFSALLNYRHTAAGPAVMAQAEVAFAGIENLGSEERTNYPLTLSVDDFGEGFALTVQAASGIDAAVVCGYVHRALESVIEALEHDPSRPLRSLEMLPVEERHRLLVEWNATAAAYPQQTCIHELFEAQVERTPDAIALVHEDHELSYGELNARANRLAHHLRALGVGPDDRVAICVERSAAMVVGLLAVLKAGGAYVPLDPSYPAERLDYMLSDSAPVVVLTQSGLRDMLGDGVAGIAVVELDGDGSQWGAQPDSNPDPAAVGLRSSHLAYVIYTSGSTGTPKGVMVEHRGVVNRLVWMQRAYGVSPADVVLQKTPFSFDVSVWEFFCPLIAGATLVLARPEGHKDPAYLAVADLRERRHGDALRALDAACVPGARGRRGVCAGIADGDVQRRGAAADAGATVP